MTYGLQDVALQRQHRQSTAGDDQKRLETSA